MEALRDLRPSNAVWILIVIPAGFMSALIWLFATRSSVLAAASWIPAPPPG